MLDSTHATRHFRTCVALSLSLGLLAACGGREGANEQASTTNPAAATPERTPSDEAASPDGGLFTEHEAANLRHLVGQKRWSKPGHSRYTRIELGADSDAIELPYDFPADIPIPQSGRPQRHVSSAKDGKLTVVALEDSPDGAYQFYVDELEAEGWYVETAGIGGDLTMVSASKGDRLIAVAIAEVEGETTVTLIESGATE